MNTGLFDKNGAPIKVGDRTRLILDDGEVREFDVCFKTVQRTTIKTISGFDPESVDVSITGIFFCWKGKDLLPCIDENGISDVEKMEVIKSKERHCCECRNLITTREGPRGAVYGVCKMRRYREKRYGREKACKRFQEKDGSCYRPETWEEYCERKEIKG